MKFPTFVIEMCMVTIWESPSAISEISRQKILVTVTNKKVENLILKIVIQRAIELKPFSL